MIKKYRRKQIDVEAIRFTGDNLSEIVDFLEMTKYHIMRYERGRYLTMSTVHSIENALDLEKCNRDEYLISNSGIVSAINEAEFKVTYEQEDSVEDEVLAKCPPFEIEQAINE